MLLRDEIKLRRKTLGLTKGQLAERMGVSTQSVSRWESGQATPTPDKLSMLAELFNVSPEFLASLPNKAETDLDVMRQNLRPATWYLSGMLVQSLTLALFPYFGLTPGDVVSIFNKIEEVKSIVRKQIKRIPSRTEVLSHFPEDELEVVSAVYDGLDSIVFLPQYRYSILRTCPFANYPEKDITRRVMDKNDFLETMRDFPTLMDKSDIFEIIQESRTRIKTDPQLITIMQDEPFYLTKFGISSRKRFVLIRRNEQIFEGKIHLYTFEGLSSLVKITNTIGDHCTFSTDETAQNISKEIIKSHECQIVGHVLDWA